MNDIQITIMKLDSNIIKVSLILKVTPDYQEYFSLIEVFMPHSILPVINPGLDWLCIADNGFRGACFSIFDVITTEGSSLSTWN